MLDSNGALGDAVRKMWKGRHLSQEALTKRLGVCKRAITDKMILLIIKKLFE